MRFIFIWGKIKKKSEEGYTDEWQGAWTPRTYRALGAIPSTGKKKFKINLSTPRHC